MTEPTDLQEMHIEESPVKRRKRWILAIIGLPDSGKSTFLARLYGAHLIGAPDAPSTRFSLSFPVAFDEDPEERAVLDRIKALWEWICAHFDEKKKTFENADITFNISGIGLGSGLRVHTNDLPGETFGTQGENTTGTITTEQLDKIKAEFRQRFRRANAALILIDSRKINDEDNNQLVRSILDDLPHRTRTGQPVFKLVVFTKAAQETDPEALREKLKQLESQFRKQGHSWVKVIASESLKDLVEFHNSDGSTTYSLPEIGPQAAHTELPSWIRTPSSAVLELAALYVSYKRRRNAVLSLVATLAVMIMTGFWIFQGYRSDVQRFEKAMSLPSDTRLDAIEEYLVDGSDSTLRRYIHPFKYRLQPATEKWNADFFNRCEQENNLEARRTEMDRVQKQPIWRFVDQARFTNLLTHTLSSIDNVKAQFQDDMSVWHNRALKADDPISVIDSSRYTYPSMPSLDALVLERRRILREQFDEERNAVQSFQKRCSQWRDNISNLVSELEGLATASPYRYEMLQHRRVEVLDKLGETIEATGLTHLPYQSSLLLRALISATQKQIGADSPNLARLDNVLKAVEQSIRKLQKDSADGLHMLDLKQTWTGKLEVCKKLIDELKDLPEAKDWRQRESEWHSQLTNSNHKLRDTLRKSMDLKSNPVEQLNLLNAFVSETELQHAPEHRKQAREEVIKVQGQLEALNQDWDMVEHRAMEFTKNPVALATLQDALDKYKQELLKQNRPSIEAHQSSLDKINLQISRETDRVETMKAEFNANWPLVTGDKDPRVRQQKRREIAAVLGQLHKTSDRENNRSRIANWLSNIQAMTASSEQFAQVHDDNDYSELVDALTLVQQSASALDLSAQDSSQAQASLHKIQQTWADVRWATVRTAANQEARAGRYTKAIHKLNEYLQQTNTPYFVHSDDSKTEITNHAKAWEDQISSAMGAIRDRAFKERADYDNGREEVAQLLNEYKETCQPSAALHDAKRQTLESLDTKLQEWYSQQIDNLLNDLPALKDHRVLNTWASVDNLSNRLKQICEDQVINAKFKGFAQQADRIRRRLDSLKEQRNFRLGLVNVRIEMPNDGDYNTWTKYPEPRLRLMQDKKILWELHLKDHGTERSQQDSKKRLRKYNVNEDKKNKRFLLEAGNWAGGTDGPDRIDYQRGNNLQLVLSIAGQSSAPLRLTILGSDNTPGSLLLPTNQRLTVANEVECKTRVWGSKFNMKIALTVEVFIEASDLVSFQIPATFDSWP